MGVFVIALVIAGLGATRLPLVWPLAWLLLAVAMMLLRWHVLGRLPDKTHLPTEQRIQVIFWMSFANGVVFALSHLAFPFLSLAGRSVHTLILLGLVSGAVATTGGHKKTFLAYTLPTLLPIVALWAFSPGLAEVTWAERTMALLTLVYLWIVLGLASDAWTTFVESCEIRFQERELNDKLKVALDQADAANRAKTRFLAAASHDLRQPLHTLTLLGAALGMRDIDPRSKEIVKVLNEVTDNLSAQLDGLLDISKLDAGIVQADMRPVKLADVVRQHFGEIDAIARARGLEPRLAIHSEQLVNTDAHLLMRILRNLTQNAIKFTEQGHVTLMVRHRGERMLLTVTDSGRGIAEQHQEEVFQEFYQVDNPERDRSKGLGLGLSIVRRLCELLRIELTMASQAGVGTSFTLEMPVATQVISTLVAPVVHTGATQFSLRVLVIDDERSVRLGLRIVLEEMGCECIEASGTEEACAMVRDRAPHLVLADFRLRGDDDGIASIRAIRALWPQVSAVLVSGDTAPDRLLEAERAGMRLLHKPLPLDTLRDELARAQSMAPDWQPRLADTAGMRA